MDIGYSFGQMIWIVLVYSFLGWCCEVAFAAVRRGIFVNRGFLNGPVCPIYGFGVLIVLLVLEPVKDNLALLFFGSMVLGLSSSRRCYSSDDLLAHLRHPRIAQPLAHGLLHRSAHFRRSHHALEHAQAAEASARYRRA